MSNSIDGHLNNVAKGFEKLLNSHGYGFHYSALKRANDLFDSGNSPWSFVAAEVPVEVRGSGTRIDFILQRRSRFDRSDRPDYFLLVECKRVNPALSNWCFIKAPYVRPDYFDGHLLWQQVYHEPTTTTVDILHPISSSLYITSVGDKFPAYHIALEVRSNAQGEPSSQGRGGIEDAATQTLRGLNGMVEFLKHETRLFPPSRKVVLIPAVFTTAKLCVSDADLKSADLSTGNIDLSQSSFKEVDWLLYEYNMSPGLTHQQRKTETVPSFTVGSVIQRDFARTIAVVNAGGIEAFLRWVGSIDA